MARPTDEPFYFNTEPPGATVLEAYHSDFGVSVAFVNGGYEPASVQVRTSNEGPPLYRFFLYAGETVLQLWPTGLEFPLNLDPIRAAEVLMAAATEEINNPPRRLVLNMEPPAPPAPFPDPEAC